MRRDLIIMPVVVLATALSCLALLEGGARLIEPEHLAELCKSGNGAGFTPNCVSTMKAAEGPLVTLQYNECGSRSAQSCLTPPENNYRVVTLGSSISRGFAVAYDDMYASRLARGLQQSYGRPVDVQNVPIAWPQSPDDMAWSQLAEQTQAALRLHPETLLLFVASWDLYKYHDAAPSASPKTGGEPGGFRASAVFKMASNLMGTLRAWREDSRAVLMLRHLIYRDDSNFIDAYMHNGEESDYLRDPVTAAWRQKLAMLEKVVAIIADAAGREKVPTLLVFVPFEPQVSFARGDVPVRPGIDPLLLDRQIASIAERNRIGFVDALPAFVAAPPGKSYYYRVNGHPDAQGHEVIAKALLQCMTGLKPAVGCLNLAAQQ